MNATPALRARFDAQIAAHPFWSNALLAGCEAGALDRAGFQLVFGQYAHYSRAFTRLLAGVMLRCEDDGLRTQLSENLWEEGGGADPSARHAALFRHFLRDALGVQPAPPLACTRWFVDQLVAAASHSDPVYATAVVALGTEGIVSRLYRGFVRGLEQAGVPREQLRFFDLHIGCDDDHAETLWQMLVALQDQTGWQGSVERAIDDTLSLRAAWFDALAAEVRMQRVSALVSRAADRTPRPLPDAPRLAARPGQAHAPLYRNHNARLGIDFAVERLEFTDREVMDVRVVTVAPGATTERHTHAHESVFFVSSGRGEVLVGDRVVPLEPGAVAFVPRWHFHQHRNTGHEPLTLVAVTDFGFTSSVLGDYDARTRQRPR